MQGLRRDFQELGAAAREATGAAADSEAAATGAAGAHGGSGRAAGGMGAAMTKLAKVGAVGLVALGFTAVKMSNTFQTEMLKIRTEAGASGKEFRTMRKDVLNMAATGKSFGEGPTSLAQGLYHLESMGIRGKRAILGLKLASQEAAISGASLEDTTTSLGGALFIAAKGTGTLRQTMGALNAIAGAGNMRFQDLNDALGQGLLGSAKIAGVSLQETGAALAVLTDSGYKASSAGAQLATALHYLYAPSTKAQNALAAIGLTGGKLAADLHKPQGILMALRDLRSHMKGLSQIQQADVLNQILPGGRGRVLLNLYQLQNRLSPKYSQIRGTQGDYGAHALQQMNNPTTKMRIQVAKLEASMIKLGDTIKKYLMPVALALAGTLLKVLNVLISVIQWFIKGSPVAKAVLALIIALTAAFTAYWTITKAVAIAQGILNAVMDANPISLVIIAIAALAAGFIYLYNKVGWFRKDAQAVFKWLKTAVSDVVNFVWKHWKMFAVGGAFFLGGPFAAAAVFIATHFKAVKGIVIDVANALISAINWVIRQVNSFIKSYNSIVGSIPIFGGSLKVGTIGQLQLISNGGSKAPASSGPTNSAMPVGRLRSVIANNERYAAVKAADHGWAGNADIVIKLREKEIARVTKREVQKAQMG